jgi:hypothetical protein
MHKLWRLGVVLALIAVGCRAEVNVVVEVEEDGSGIYAAEVGLDEELQEIFANFGAETGDFLSNFDLDLPEASETSERVEGDMTYFVTTFSFENPEELDAVIASASTDAGSQFANFNLTVDESGAELDAEIVVPDATEGLSQAEGLGLDPTLLTEEFFSVNVIVGMPGTVEESNADRTLSDGRLQWSLPLTGGNVDLYAVSTTGGGGFPWWIFGAALLVLFALLVWWYFTRRSDQQPIKAIQAADAAADSDNTGLT